MIPPMQSWAEPVPAGLLATLAAIPGAAQAAFAAAGWFVLLALFIALRRRSRTRSGRTLGSRDGSHASSGQTQPEFLEQRARRVLQPPLTKEELALRSAVRSEVDEPASGSHGSSDWPNRQMILTMLSSEPERLVDRHPLATATFDKGVAGIRPFGGGHSFAVPFVTSEGGQWILRFFNSRPTPDQAARYELLHALSPEARSDLGVPAVAWFDTCLKEDDPPQEPLPAVVMKRVVGDQLDRFVSSNYTNRSVMLSAATRLRDRLLSFEARQFAHGDLQDGNLFVCGTAKAMSIWFVDFDDCYLPGLTPSHAVGHPNYQHPGRNPEDWGPLMDGFSGLLMWLALRGIAADPHLWEDNDDDGRLLFEANDLACPGETELWRSLRKSSDREVREATDKLATLCASSSPPAEPFTRLLPGWWA